MRRVRRLLLLAILVIIVVVGVNYYYQKRLVSSQAPAPPKSLPSGTRAAASDWHWAHTVEGRSVVEVRAKDFRQVEEPSRFDLEQVEIRLYDAKGKTFDRVRSARADFDIGSSILYADGDVEIAMGVSEEQLPSGRLVEIRTSGVTFETKTGKASTDRRADFVFDQGEGKAIGASYDPGARELHLNSKVELLWKGQDPTAKPMRIEAGGLVYREFDSMIHLLSWSRLSREKMVLEAGEARVLLEKGAIRRVDAEGARGTDRYPGRELAYAADHLNLRFSNRTEVEKIIGEQNASLVSVAGGTRTSVKTNRVDLDFQTGSGESQLMKALSSGSTVVESSPVSVVGPMAPDTRVLRSEVVSLEMRPGGQEIEVIETRTPGQLELVPNRAGKPHRWVDGERMRLEYGPGNLVRFFRAENAATRTERQQEQGGRSAPVLRTWSKELLAEFDLSTGQLARMEQRGEFRYQEGEREARAERALMEPAQQLITLQEKARMWDQAGSVSADKILLSQDNGDVAADGSVRLTWFSDGGKEGSGMLSGDEPLYAMSTRLFSTDGNLKLRCEEDAVLWQGATRITADVIELDRAKQRLVGTGNVATRFPDLQSPASVGGEPTPEISLVFISAAQFIYTEEDRLAHYSGGALLRRLGLEVTAKEMRARLAEGGEGSQLERAYADGRVEIVQTGQGRTRRGSSEHAEYDLKEDKIVLYGGAPVLTDSLRGSTRGDKLTYFAGSDRLLVDGTEGQRSVSRVLRK